MIDHGFAEHFREYGKRRSPVQRSDGPFGTLFQ
jgi:hypothetical protein